MQQLSVGLIIKQALAIGLKNAPSLLGAFVLWVLTIWIPYLNVGTTIGLFGMAAKMGRGEVVSPTAIFAKEYRKQMGEFFLVMAFVMIGVYAGMVFVIIPGIVIGLAWSLAPLLVLDKGRNPTAALQESNDLTYGKKWTILFGNLVVSMIFVVAIAIFGVIGAKVHPAIGGLITVVLTILWGAASMAATAVVYSTLTASPTVQQAK